MQKNFRQRRLFSSSVQHVFSGPWRDWSRLRHKSAFALSVKHCLKKGLKLGRNQKYHIFRNEQGKKSAIYTIQVSHNTQSKKLTKPGQVATPWGRLLHPGAGCYTMGQVDTPWGRLIYTMGQVYTPQGWLIHPRAG